MRILHLGFEDHRRPGSGGGSLRSYEINQRLAARGHQIEVVTARYPSAERRVERAVSYRHVGVGAGYFTSIVTYHAALPAVVVAANHARPQPDLLVEEFAPPWSSFGVTRLSAIPSIGNVQGYFAAEKAREYHVPAWALTALERFGARSHRHLIALSGDLARRLAADAPDSHISTIPLGIDPAVIATALEPAPAPVRGQIVFLGRLEIRQKGLDLLLQACDGLLERLDARLVIAGDGRDESAVRRLASASPDAGRITLVGRISGVEKWRLLASSEVCVMPSRYETFGLSALEALACGTPVAGFDIDCLRDTVPAGAGRLVTPFDVEALGDAITLLLSDASLRARMGEHGRSHALRHTWDAIADAQEHAYELAAEREGR